MRRTIDDLSDFNVKFIIEEFKEQGLKHGVARKKFLQEWHVSSIHDIERVHKIVDSVYGE